MEVNTKTIVTVEEVSQMIESKYCNSSINPVDAEKLRVKLDSMFGQWAEMD